MRKREVEFVKMAGGGNDFVVVDGIAREAAFLLEEDRLRKICARRLGVGADGVVVIGRSEKADFSLRFFNSDGSEHDFCGNGTRCAARLFHESRQMEGRLAIETPGRIVEAEVKGGEVTINLERPADPEEVGEISVEGSPYRGAFVVAGVPHFVAKVKDPDTLDVEKIGAALRNHPRFQPEGTNVDFVAPLSERSLRIRTYERGVEGETLSCGSGCIASAFALYREGVLDREVDCVTQSGVVLRIALPEKGEDRILLTGDALVVYRGVVELDPSRNG